MISSTFNFIPHKLSREEQKKIIPKLEEFFKIVTSNKEHYIDSLREELNSEGHNPYFYFDGGILLMELSVEKSDLQIVADALVKSDLRDLPPATYLHHLLKLSIADVDVIDAALHIFDDSTFKVFIPQHALSLNQGNALKFILPRYDSNLYVGKLIDRYNSIDSLETKKEILELLFFASNCKADSFIKTIEVDEDTKPEIKSLLLKLNQIDFGSRTNNNEVYSSTHLEIRERLVRISDEALYELMDLVRKLKQNYICEN